VAAELACGFLEVLIKCSAKELKSGQAIRQSELDGNFLTSGSRNP